MKLLLLFIGLFFLGCSSQKLRTKKTVKVYHGSGMTSIKKFQYYKRLYEKKNPDINIENIRVDGQYYDKLQTLVASGAEDIDVLWLGLGFPIFAEKNILCDLSDILKKNNFNKEMYYKNIMEWYSYKDRIYGLPFALTPAVFIYNKNIFEQNGMTHPQADWTYSEMKNLAIKLTRKDTVGNIGTIWGVGALDPFSCLLSFGKGITDENFKKCLLSDREAYLAMQFMHDMIFRLKIQPKKGDMNDQKAHQIFANNKIAMTVGHTWDMQQLLEIKNITWDIANHPKEKLSRNWISTEGLSVYKNSRKKEDAVKYILFVTGEEMQKKFINENCPSIINLLSDNELHKKTIYNWKILPSYIENGVTEPKTAKVFEIKSKFTMMIEEIMTKENSPKQIQFILEKYTKIINEVLNSD